MVSRESVIPLFLVSLGEAVDIVLYGLTVDLFVQILLASTVGDLTQAIFELIGQTLVRDSLERATKKYKTLNAIVEKYKLSIINTYPRTQTMINTKGIIFNDHVKLQMHAKVTHSDNRTIS